MLIDYDWTAISYVPLDISYILLWFTGESPPNPTYDYCKINLAVSIMQYDITSRKHRIVCSYMFLRLSLFFQ